MGAVAPTWLGNVGKSALQLRKANRSLTALGGPGLGGLPAQVLKENVRGATASSLTGTTLKSVLPNKQVGCEDECARFRLGTGTMAGLTSIF
jgi:hypothetical protein